MSTSTALAAELYNILTTDDLPNQNYVVVMLLHRVRDKGISRDQIVTAVLTHAVEDTSDGAKTAACLFGVLREYATEAKGNMGDMTILTPNDVSDGIVGAAMLSERSDMLDTFIQHHIDPRKTWKFGHLTVDLWYWVTLCGSELQYQYMLDASEMEPPVRPIAGIHHITQAVELIRKAVEATCWNGFEFGDGFATRRDILDLLVKCKVDAASNPSFQYRRSLTRNTGLLSYLAADKRKTVTVYNYVCTLLKTDQEVPPARIDTYARADPNELPTKDDCLAHDSKGTYRGPLETPLIEAVMNEWEEMVVVLLNVGADPDVRGHSGMTAYGAAVAYRLGSMIEILRQNGCANEGVRPAYANWWVEEDAAISWDDFWEVGINFWADD